MRGRDVAVSVLALAATAALCLAAAAQVTQIHLELVVPGARVDTPVPPDCTVWHELYPDHCAPRHQDAYEDDGDGFISACDRITLDGVSGHVEWVGPTYHLLPVGNSRQGMYLEPTTLSGGRNPVCETWHEVYPNHCIAHHVDGWEDNGDGLLGPCDIVIFMGEPWHLEEIGLNIIVVPDSPVEPGTWSRLKGLFRTLFN